MPSANIELWASGRHHYNLDSKNPTWFQKVNRDGSLGKWIDSGSDQVTACGRGGWYEMRDVIINLENK